MTTMTHPDTTAAPKIQRRSVPRAPRIERRNDDATVGGATIAGYAAVFYDGTPETEYRLWDDFVERVMPGAFDRAIREDDVRALLNHEPDNLLGRTKSGTLKLSIDAVGLRYEITPPETELARQVVASLERGDLDGSSFTFMPTKVTWREELEKVGTMERMIVIREIQEVELYDVGPVTFPAYTATSAAARDRSNEPELLRAEYEASKKKNEVGIGRDAILARARLVALDEENLMAIT